MVFCGHIFGGGHYTHPYPYLNSTIILFDKNSLATCIAQHATSVQQHKFDSSDIYQTALLLQLKASVLFILSIIFLLFYKKRKLNGNLLCLFLFNNRTFTVKIS